MFKYYRLLGLFILLTWLAWAVTGFTARQYEVLPEQGVLQVAEDTLTLSQLAERYQPYLYFEPNVDDKTEPAGMYYEVIAQDNLIHIVYHVQWIDEIHPNIGIHYLYKFYRMAKYGFPCRDSEFIQVSIDKTTGKIRALLFEAKTSDAAFNTGFQAHRIARVELDSVGNTHLSIRDKTDNKPLDGRSIQLDIQDNTHPKLGITTWNHLFRADSINDFTLKENMSLHYLDDWNYRVQKFARKSQSDFRSHESIWSKGLAYSLASLLMLIGWAVNRYRNKH